MVSAVISNNSAASAEAPVAAGASSSENSGNASAAPAAGAASAPGPKAKSANLGIDISTSSPEAAEALLQLSLLANRLNAKVNTGRRTQGIKNQAEQERFLKQIEQLEKAAKAAKTGLISKIFGWVMKVVALVAAAAMTVATMGLGAPIMLGIATLLAAYDIAASAAKEANPDLKISLEDGMGEFVGALAKAAGASEEEVAKAKQWGGMALALALQLGVAIAALPSSATSKATAAMEAMSNLLTNLGTMFSRFGTATGQMLGQAFKSLGANMPLVQKTLQSAPQLTDELAAGASAASKAADGAEAAADAAGKGSRLANASPDLEATTATAMKLSSQFAGLMGYVNAGATIANSAAGITAGVAQHEAAKAEADALETTALVNWLLANFDKQKEEIKYLAQEKIAVEKKVHQMADSRYELNQSIADSFSSGGAGLGMSGGGLV